MWARREGAAVTLSDGQQRGATHLHEVHQLVGRQQAQAFEVGRDVGDGRQEALVERREVDALGREQAMNEKHHKVAVGARLERHIVDRNRGVVFLEAEGRRKVVRARERTKK